jgi:protein TonB
VNLLEGKPRKNRKRRSTFIPFLLGSILLHLFILFLFFLYPLYFGDRQVVRTKEKPKFIEITELPIPKEKETEPPKEVKRYAERSHKALEEKTRDDFTKKGSVTPLPQAKQLPRQSKKVKIAKEKPKKEESTKKPPQVASLPKDIRKDLEPPKEKSEEEKLASITKEKLFNPSFSQLPQSSSQDFEGSRDVEKKEDTVDLNTTEFKYFSYFLKIKRQIEGVWHYPEVSRARGEQGELFLIFTIRKDGYLENVKLIDSSGYTRLDDEAIRAIRVAAPFPPFPDQWEGLERLHVRAVFRYEIRYGWRVY